MLLTIRKEPERFGLDELKAGQLEVRGVGIVVRGM
jgi:hypothetical protein